MMLHDRVHSPLNPPLNPPLNCERWSAVDRLFQEACDLPSHERDAFLSSRCGGDETLLAEIRSLLDAGTRDERFLDWNLPAEAVGAANHSERRREGDLVGRDVGNYRITRFIAAGGMGAVYEAQQKHPKRTVALKFLRSGWVTPAARQRFEQEAEALARMKHPAVAQIHDAGTVDDAMGPLLYFAMEFVTDAKTIIDFAEDRALTLAQRIDLFALVCDAVHHGHQRGIIHRDLKPGNILVDGGGAAKVIDFGVARLADGDSTSPRITRTITPVIGTLAYMSPEQLHSDALDIDTRSDVYALGVVMYELLTRRLPHDVSGKPLSEVMRIIGEDAPAAPSDFDAAIDRDLDAIILKSLQKAREHRYQSSAEFAEDIRRWQRHEPVNAQPPAAMYHLRKWARRHRPLVVGAAVAVLGLCAGLVGAVWQASEARQAEREARQAEKDAGDSAARAQREADSAIRTARSLIEVLRAFDPLRADRGFTLPNAEDQAALVDAYARIIDEQLQADPVVQASLLEGLGNIYANMGRFEDAHRVLDRAMELRIANQGEGHSDMVRTRFSQAMLAMREDDVPRAGDIVRRAYDLALTLPAGNPRVGEAIVQMRGIAYMTGDYAEAERFSRAALEWLMTHGDGARLFEPQTQLADVLRVRGELEEARDLYREVYEGRNEIGGEASVDAGAALYYLAHNDIQRGDQPAIDEHLQRALRQRELARSLPERHPHRAGSLLLLGELRMARGELDEAETLLRECVTMREASLPDGHRLIAYARSLLGECLTRRGQFDEAESLLIESHETLRRGYGEFAGWTVDSRNRIEQLEAARAAVTQDR